MINIINSQVLATEKHEQTYLCEWEKFKPLPPPFQPTPFVPARTWRAADGVEKKSELPALKDDGKWEPFMMEAIYDMICNRQEAVHTFMYNVHLWENSWLATLNALGRRMENSLGFLPVDQLWSNCRMINQEWSNWEHKLTLARTKIVETKQQHAHQLSVMLANLQRQPLDANSDAHELLAKGAAQAAGQQLVSRDNHTEQWMNTTTEDGEHLPATMKTTFGLVGTWPIEECVLAYGHSVIEAYQQPKLEDIADMIQPNAINLSHPPKKGDKKKGGGTAPNSRSRKLEDSDWNEITTKHSASKKKQELKHSGPLDHTMYDWTVYVRRIGGPPIGNFVRKVIFQAEEGDVKAELLREPFCVSGSSFGNSVVYFTIFFQCPKLPPLHVQHPIMVRLPVPNAHPHTADPLNPAGNNRCGPLRVEYARTVYRITHTVHLGGARIFDCSEEASERFKHLVPLPKPKPKPKRSSRPANVQSSRSKKKGSAKRTATSAQLMGTDDIAAGLVSGSADDAAFSPDRSDDTDTMAAAGGECPDPSGTAKLHGRSRIQRVPIKREPTTDQVMPSAVYHHGDDLPENVNMTDSSGGIGSPSAQSVDCNSSPQVQPFSTIKTQRRTGRGVNAKPKASRRLVLVTKSRSSSSSGTNTLSASPCRVDQHHLQCYRSSTPPNQGTQRISEYTTPSPHHTVSPHHHHPHHLHPTTPNLASPEPSLLPRSSSRLGDISLSSNPLLSSLYGGLDTAEFPSNSQLVPGTSADIFNNIPSINLLGTTDTLEKDLTIPDISKLDSINMADSTSSMTTPKGDNTPLFSTLLRVDASPPRNTHNNNANTETSVGPATQQQQQGKTQQGADFLLPPTDEPASNNTPSPVRTTPQDASTPLCGSSNNNVPNHLDHHHQPPSPNVPSTPPTQQHKPHNTYPTQLNGLPTPPFNQTPYDFQPHTYSFDHGFPPSINPMHSNNSYTNNNYHTYSLGSNGSLVLPGCNSMLIHPTPSFGGMNNLYIVGSSSTGSANFGN